MLCLHWRCNRPAHKFGEGKKNAPAGGRLFLYRHPAAELRQSSFFSSFSTTFIGSGM